MRKSISFSYLALVSLLMSCGPAAEDRERMHERAKVFQDSIATFIRQSMAEAEMPGNAVMHDHSGTQPCPVCGVVVDSTQSRNPNRTPSQPNQ